MRFLSLLCDYMVQTVRCIYMFIARLIARTSNSLPMLLCLFDFLATYHLCILNILCCCYDFDRKVAFHRQNKKNNVQLLTL